MGMAVTNVFGSRSEDWGECGEIVGECGRLWEVVGECGEVVTDSGSYRCLPALKLDLCQAIAHALVNRV